MAAYKDGKCILNLTNIEQIAKQDEKKANTQMIRLNIEQDKLD